MSWKRCWSNNHFYYDNDDDQIVPDIDRTPRSTLPNVSTLVDNSSNFHRTIDTGTSSSTVNGKHRSLYAASERIKEVTHQKSPTMSQLSNLHPHPILAFGIKASPLPSSSSHSSPAASPSLSWSKNQVNNWDSYHNSGLSNSAKKSKKHSTLDSNDFWEEKYSRIAIITTTHHPLATPPQISKF